MRLFSTSYPRYYHYDVAKTSATMPNDVGSREMYFPLFLYRIVQTARRPVRYSSGGGKWSDNRSDRRARRSENVRHTRIRCSVSYPKGILRSLSLSLRYVSSAEVGSRRRRHVTAIVQDRFKRVARKTGPIGGYHTGSRIQACGA